MPIRRRRDNNNWLIDFTPSHGGRIRKTVDEKFTKRQVEAMERKLRQTEEESPKKRNAKVLHIDGVI